MATRGDVLDRVGDLLEDKTNTTRTRLEPWVSFVLSEMKQAGVIGPETSATIATVAGTAVYNLPTDIDVVTGVFLNDDSGSPLVQIPQYRMNEYLADDDDFGGIPEEYAIYPRNITGTTPVIRLWPIPNAVKSLIVQYESNFASLASDAATLTITADAFSTVVWGVYRIFTRVEEHDDIQGATAEFQESLRRLKFKQVGTLNRTYAVKYND